MSTDSTCHPTLPVNILSLSLLLLHLGPLLLHVNGGAPTPARAPGCSPLASSCVPTMVATSFDPLSSDGGTRAGDSRTQRGPARRRCCRRGGATVTGRRGPVRHRRRSVRKGGGCREWERMENKRIGTHNHW